MPLLLRWRTRWAHSLTRICRRCIFYRVTTERTAAERGEGLEPYVLRRLEIRSHSWHENGSRNEGRGDEDVLEAGTVDLKRFDGSWLKVTSGGDVSLHMGVVESLRCTQGSGRGWARL